MERGANICAYKNCQDNEHYYECAIGQASKNGHLQVVSYLVEKGTNIELECYNSAIQLAVENGHLEVVRYLMEKEVVNYLIKKETNIHVYNDAIKLAVENGHLEVVNYLVEEGSKYPC